MKNLRINTKNILIGIIIILIIITFLYFIRNNNIDNFLACPPGQVSQSVRSGGIGNKTFGRKHKGEICLKKSKNYQWKKRIFILKT